MMTLPPFVTILALLQLWKFSLSVCCQGSLSSSRLAPSHKQLQQGGKEPRHGAPNPQRHRLEVCSAVSSLLLLSMLTKLKISLSYTVVPMETGPKSFG